MTIPYGRQNIDENDIQAVVDVLRSDYLTQGPVVGRFEEALARQCQAGYAVAVNSATSALHIACLALGLGPGDWLWTSPITFVASANCGLYCGAQVDFVDIDPYSFNLCPQTLERKLVSAEKAGRLPKIIVPVHLCGHPCDMATLGALSQRFGFKIIEDASHAIGAIYQGEPVGSCRYSDITVFSFHPVKIITTGEGGAALTNQAELADRMTRLRSHGITRDPSKMEGAFEGPWYYQQTELGFNYRMTDLQAALGLTQLGRLNTFITRRRFLAHSYSRLLKDIPLTLPLDDPGSSWHIYCVQIHGEDSRRDIVEHMQKCGIGVNVHYIPVYLQPYYRRLGFSPGYCPFAEKYYQRALTLPLYPGLNEIQQKEVARQLCNKLKKH